MGMEVLSSVCVKVKEVQAAMLAASPQIKSLNSSHKIETHSLCISSNLSHALCKANIEDMALLEKIAETFPVYHSSLSKQVVIWWIACKRRMRDTHLYAWRSASELAREILHDGLADMAASQAPMAPSSAPCTS